MTFSIQKLFDSRLGENYELHRKYINPTFAEVLKVIGFDRFYVKGEGPYLYDKEGNRYLDFICGYGVFNLGRNHPKIKAALEEYLGMNYPNLVKMDSPLVAGLLAEALVKRCPPGLERVWFGNSGSEGVETAMKFTRAATGKYKTLFAKSAFHGLTYGSLSLNGDEHFREGFGPLMPGCEQVPLNDLDALDRALSTREYSAFFVEPIQGKGLFVCDSNYLTEAKNLCAKYGSYLIIDEVQSGMGRTGKFLALEHWGVEPDGVILSKSLSGGQVPISAFIGRKEIFDKVFSRLDRCVVHSTTFGQNAMAMVAGLATLHIMDEEKLIENADRVGNYLKNELIKRKERFELLKDVRGKGLYLGVEFGNPKSLTLKAAWKLLHKADAGLFAQAIIMPLIDDHHVLTQVAGHNMDTIKLAPALCVTQKDMDDFLLAFDQVMEKCHRFPGPVWEVGARLTKHALKGSSKGRKGEEASL